jgi:hypothetical protein
MSILTTQITSTLVDPSLTPLTGVPVVATLKGSRTTLSGTAVNREEKVYTDDITGVWTISLVPNSLFGPDSYYLLRVGAKEEYEIVVPVTTEDAPIGLNSVLRENSVAVIQSAFVGNMNLDGDVIVEGNLSVTGDLAADAILEHATIDGDYISTFPGNLDVIGDLIVSGTLSVTGTVTVGA